MKDLIPVLVMILLVVVMVSLSVWWFIATWEECRAFGHSFFYCLRMVSSK